MKKYLYPIILVLAAGACKPKSADKAQQTDPGFKKTSKDKFHYTDSIFYKYAKYVESLDMKTAVSVTKAAEKYVEMFKGKDPKICDTAFLTFNKFYSTVTESLEEVNEKDSIDLDKYFGYVKKPALTPAVLAYIKDLKDNGFAITESEGAMYVSEDRDFVAKYFYNLVSPTMKEYLVQVNKENKQIYMEDGSLTIGVDSLVDRTVWWERFEKANPGFIWRNEVSASKKEYQFVLLVGSDNSPVFTPGDKKPDQNFIKAYAYLSSKYPDTETNKLIKPYYDLLLKGNYKKAEELADSYQKNGVFKVKQ